LLSYGRKCAEKQRDFCTSGKKFTSAAVIKGA
jgi:hypothetical protein